MGRSHRRFGKEFETEALLLVKKSAGRRSRLRRISASGFRRCDSGWASAANGSLEHRPRIFRRTWRAS